MKKERSKSSLVLRVMREFSCEFLCVSYFWKHKLAEFSAPNLLFAENKKKVRVRLNIGTVFKSAICSS